MGITAVISLSITAAGFIGGIITVVAKLAERFGKMEQRLQTDEELARDERAKRHELAVRQTEYSATQSAIMARLDAISEDLKELKEAVKSGK